MTGEVHHFTTPLWRWQNESQGSWHFITVPSPVDEALSAHALMQRLELGRRRGFGAIKVRIQIGESQWDTSAFPLRDTGWAIPVSAKIRKAEALSEGDMVDVTLGF
ncbi:hypothetical protein Y88_1163 [Novosphingobium nitrogenifigens DSM 19370]|uniref:DUF1905 domain-containing protein n=1 Tax=Novosphingobium nitrogenifigens DSM 19370 TaxID=983920 RepID=F1Z8C4_9SPHN|nr:DUF1905 domain-containing protein [Novosphingobium nitrogenifigens]EGD59101.1 hypothetical protein Y88_1163 [Novosphingobium nitrogenifigens DSM 19370]